MPSSNTASLDARLRAVAVAMLAAWMGERFFRTFRPEDAAGSAFDAVLTQRERRIGVTCGLLWDGTPPPGSEAIAELIEADLDDGPDAGHGYVIWIPPGGELPGGEPRRSDLRVTLGGGLASLEPGERREVRLPVTLPIAKVDTEGAYMSASGPIASEWTTLSEGISGAFHLDGRAFRRLPEERAELDIVLTRIRDRAQLLEQGEVTPVEVHDYWLVSRIPGDEPAGVTCFGAPPEFDPSDGATVRRRLRAELQRAREQIALARETGEEFAISALVLGAPLAHIQEEMATAALRGMSPAVYGGIDLVALVADGAVKQLLQPRALPWEERPPAR